MISWLHRLSGFKASLKRHAILNCSAVVNQRENQGSSRWIKWLHFFQLASPNSINIQPNLFILWKSTCLEGRGNVKVLLYTLKPTFCACIFMKMPKLVIFGKSTIWQTAQFSHGKEQRNNLPRGCPGQPRSKEKRSIPIPRSRASISVLGQANEVQSWASTTQLLYTENESQTVSYDPTFLYVGSFN